MRTATCRCCALAFSYERQGSGRLRQYCSRRCREKYCRDREALRALCSEPDCKRGVRARGLCSTHYNRTYHPGSQKLYPAKPETRRAALHRKNVKRRIATRGAAEVFDHREIFERDRWRCGICGRRVDRRLQHPHPRSASLDHIVPLSEDPTGHTRANVRLAHLDCNVRRSNKGGGEQLLLFGEVA